MTFELSWLDRLAKLDPPVAPSPLRRADGRLAPLVTDGADAKAGALWTLYGWVEGAPLGRLPSREEAGATGKMISAMHASAASIAPPIDAATRSYDSSHFSHRAAAFFKHVAHRIERDDRTALDQAVGLGCRKLDGLRADGVYPIHCDLHDGNLIWAEGASSPVAIDFGRGGMGPFELDIAMAQHYLTPELAGALLAGYEASGGDIRGGALRELRFLAAIENLATLSNYPAELDGVLAELPWLVSQAKNLIGNF